jgi:hypothetical protein
MRTALLRASSSRQRAFSCRADPSRSSPVVVKRTLATSMCGNIVGTICAWCRRGSIVGVSHGFWLIARLTRIIVWIVAGVLPLALVVGGSTSLKDLVHRGAGFFSACGGHAGIPAIAATRVIRMVLSCLVSRAATRSRGRAGFRTTAPARAHWPSSRSASGLAWVQVTTGPCLVESNYYCIRLSRLPWGSARSLMLSPHTVSSFSTIRRR